MIKCISMALIYAGEMTHFSSTTSKRASKYRFSSFNTSYFVLPVSTSVWAQWPVTSSH